MAGRRQNLLDERDDSSVLFDPDYQVLSLVNQGELSREEKRSVEAYRHHRTVERLTAAKAAEGNRLIGRMTQSGVDYYVETVDVIEDNKAKMRHSSNKSYVEEFGHRMKVKAANGIFACQDVGTQAIVEVVGRTIIVERERRRLTFAERLTGRIGE